MPQKPSPAARRTIWIGKTEGFAETIVVPALLAMMAGAGFVDFWIRKPRGTQTYPPAGTLLRMNPKSHLRKCKILNPRSQDGKIESSAAMKAASALLARMAGVVSAACRDKCLGFSLLVSIAVLFPAIRALPGNAVTGHPPEIFLHATLADGKSAPASPAKWRMLAAAGAGTFFCQSAFFFI
jgi:hypothetical protein